MAFLSAMVECAACNSLFSCNPDLVPSIRLLGEGPKLPICRSCIESANEKRLAAGRDLLVILPGAYEAQEV